MIKLFPLITNKETMEPKKKKITFTHVTLKYVFYRLKTTLNEH